MNKEIKKEFMLLRKQLLRIEKKLDRHKTKLNKIKKQGGCGLVVDELGGYVGIASC